MVAPSRASPLPCLHPHALPAWLQRTRVTCAQALRHLAGHRGLCGRRGDDGGWHSGRSLALAVATALHELARAGGCESPLAGGALPARGCASRQLPDTWSQGPAPQPCFVLISAMSGAVTLN